VSEGPPTGRANDGDDDEAEEEDEEDIGVKSDVENADDDEKRGADRTEDSVGRKFAAP
jgi:hypothetical protein